MTPTELIEDWHRRAEESQFGHYEAAKFHGRQHYAIGIPVVSLTAIVGTSIFATLQNEAPMVVRILLGLLSVGAAVLSALQTFLGSSERAEKHRAAGAAYGSLRRELDQVTAIGLPRGEELAALMDRFREKFDELAKQAPEISPKIWKKTEAVLASYHSAENV